MGTNVWVMTDTGVQTEIGVVRAFLGALERGDVDGAMALVDPSIVYQNVPLPAARGERAVERQLRLMTRYDVGFEARIHNIASDGAVVLTERTDIIEFGRFPVAFWVCGTFEVRDGKVTLWRDYFDYVDVLIAFVKAPLRALRSRSAVGSSEGGRLSNGVGRH